MVLYLLPGVGCDHRLFSRLQLPDMEVKVLEWPPFAKGCTLHELAAEMSREVDASRPHVLAGVSMGGMVAQELAVITKPEMVVLVSSWTGPREWPQYVRWASRLHLWNLVRTRSMRMAWPLKQMLGPRPGEIDGLLWDMAGSQGADKIRSGLEAVLRWKGSPWRGPVYRIHGDNDHVIPLRFPVDHVVKGGEHIMVLTKAVEVAGAMGEAMRRGAVAPQPL
ncbi:MAG: alpha/beta hydrolase [Bacteroidetes bacterium]|nr:alpha/beta hydrolase [Bacteroidota bacterium]